MAFAIFLLLAASFFVLGSSQDLKCILADAPQGNVWSVGVEPAYGITGKCLPGNPILDVCYYFGVIYTAGPTSTLPGADPSMGGHIARVDSTCEPELIAQFTAACTAIGCDDSLLVFAVEGVGIKSINHDGSDEYILADIPGSFVRSIFLDTSTQTCYFVDITTNAIYAVDYDSSTATASSTVGEATAFGTAAVGAVAVTVDSVPRRYCANGELAVFWSYGEMDCELRNMAIEGTSSNREEGAAFSALRGSEKTLTLGRNRNGAEKLKFDFGYAAEVFSVTIDYKLSYQIALRLFNEMEEVFFELKEDRDASGWRNGVTWYIDDPIFATGGEISFGSFEPSYEVKIRNLVFEVCTGGVVCGTIIDANNPDPQAPSETGTTSDMRSLNILYSDCRVERCHASGRFNVCSILHPSSGSRSCLAMSGTADRVIIYDDNNNVILIDVTKSPPDVMTISTSVADVVGIDCYVDDGTEPCFPNPCENGAFCARDYSSPFQVWCFDFETQIWQLKSLLETL